MRSGSIVILMPTHDGTVHFSTFASVSHMVNQSTQNDIPVMFPPLSISGSILPEQRNMLVRLALKEGATWTLFVDSDMIVPDDGLTKLLSRNRKIISGLYINKVAPYDPVHGIRQADGTYEHMLPSNPTDMFEVDGCGAGFLLIHSSVFESVKEPWFLNEYQKRGPETVVCGEDYYFCGKAKEAGYTINVDPTVRLGHIGSATVDVGTHVDSIIAAHEEQTNNGNVNDGHDEPVADNTGDQASEESLPAERSAHGTPVVG